MCLALCLQPSTVFAFNIFTSGHKQAGLKVSFEVEDTNTRGCCY